MDSPIRQYQKQKDYQRHKLFRKIKRRKRALAEQEAEAPIREMRKRVLRRFKDGKDIKRFDDGEDVVYESPNVPINISYVPKSSIRVNPETGDVLTRDNREGALMLPEAEIKPKRRLEQVYLSQLDLNNPISKKIQQYSNANYWDPILGAPARWKASVDNGSNPLVALGSMFGTPSGENGLLSAASPISHLPGYLLKSLMRGSLLEKQLNKNGSVSVANIKNYFNNKSNVEKEVVDHVLQQLFANQTHIDYNEFRKAVQNLLIQYTRVPSRVFEDYGIDRLGYLTKSITGQDPDVFQTYNDIRTRIHDFELNHELPPRITRHTPPEMVERIRQELEAWNNTPIGQEYRALKHEMDEFYRTHPYFSTDPNNRERSFIKLLGKSGDDFRLNTFTFESPKIPIGSDKHYSPNTIGHSRTYTTAEDPSVLHVMESQSDWAQEDVFKKIIEKRKRLLEKPELFSKRVEALEKSRAELKDWENMVNTGVNHGGFKLLPWEIQQINNEFIPNTKNRIVRLLQIVNPQEDVEQISYLAKNYLLKLLLENMKFAAENGYGRMRYPTSETAAKIEGYKKEPWAVDENGNRINPHDFWNFERANENPRAPLESLFDFPEGRGGFDYKPEYKTILKKYSDFPKQYNKLYKDSDVRTILDPKGNSWYEIDIPEDYLNQEWMFDSGKDSGIHINPKNRGKFNALKKRTGKTTEQLTRSKNPLTRKRAIFAQNARKWHHK